MATKVLDLLSGALRLLRVVDVGDVPEPEDVATALSALNRMMRRWEANGLALGWNTALRADDEAPLPEEAEQAVIDNLAVRLRPEYGTALGPDVLRAASNGLAELRRDRIRAAPLAARGGCEYNTVTDEWCGGPARVSGYP